MRPTSRLSCRAAGRCGGTARSRQARRNRCSMVCTPVRNNGASRRYRVAAGERGHRFETASGDVCSASGRTRRRDFNHAPGGARAADAVRQESRGGAGPGRPSQHRQGDGRPDQADARHRRPERALDRQWHGHDPARQRRPPDPADSPGRDDRRDRILLRRCDRQGSRGLIRSVARARRPVGRATLRGRRRPRTPCA